MVARFKSHPGAGGLPRWAECEPRHTGADAVSALYVHVEQGTPGPRCVCLVCAREQSTPGPTLCLPCVCMWSKAHQSQRCDCLICARGVRHTGADAVTA
eukprot:511682-Pelagomonas_calceolata.AAC.2